MKTHLHSLMNQRLFFALTLSIVVSGCAVLPNPMTRTEQSIQIMRDKEEMAIEKDPITQPITLSESIARAIKYNLDHRVKLMEEALSQHQLDLSRYDLLPKLTAAAGYTGRDSYSESSSRDARTNQQSLAPSFSQDKNIRTADLNFSWNILDFGASYFQAQQQADRSLILKERRRKVIHSLIQQVRQAYWLTVGAQTIESQITPLLQEVEGALKDINTIEKEKLRPVLVTLNEKRQLLDTMRQLEIIRDELKQAKPHLAALMNVNPNQSFEVAITEMTIPELYDTLPEMEKTALLNRPELIEARYNERLSVLDTKKAIAKLFPGIEINVGGEYNSNSFLTNNQWADAGLRVSWNLFNILSASKVMQTVQAQEEIVRSQRMALNMAILSQVHIAYHDFESKKRQYGLAADLSEVDQSIMKYTQNTTDNDAQGKLTEIQTRLNALYSELRLYQNYGAMHSAYGTILASLGVDIIPEELSSHELSELTQAIEASNQNNWCSQLNDIQNESTQP